MFTRAAATARKVAFEKPGGNRGRGAGRWLVTRNGSGLWAWTAHDKNDKPKIGSDEDQSKNGGGVSLQNVGELRHSGSLAENKRAAFRAQLGTCKGVDFALREQGVVHCHNVETELEFPC